MLNRLANGTSNADVLDKLKVSPESSLRERPFIHQIFNCMQATEEDMTTQLRSTKEQVWTTLSLAARNLSSQMSAAKREMSQTLLSTTRNVSQSLAYSSQQLAEAKGEGMKWVLMICREMTSHPMQRKWTRRWRTPSWRWMQWSARPTVTYRRCSTTWPWRSTRSARSWTALCST